MELKLEVQSNVLKASLEDSEKLFYFSSPQAAGDAKELFKMLMWIDENTLEGGK